MKPLAIHAEDRPQDIREGPGSAADPDGKNNHAHETRGKELLLPVAHRDRRPKEKVPRYR